jgi:hypothetical protein
VHVVTAAGVESWERMAKGEVAERLAARVVRSIGTSEPVDSNAEFRCPPS